MVASHRNSRRVIKGKDKGDGIATAVYFIIAAAAVVSSAAVLWITPKYDGDLFVAIAGGRDILDGKLAAADTWSFSTGGRVWINQNWLADIIFYLIYNLLGQWGLLALKSILLLGCCLLSSAAFVKKGVALHAALPVFAAGMLCFDTYAFLRPNLFAVAIFLPTLILCIYKSSENTLYLWIAAILTTVWANTHGSYVIALFALFLIAGVRGSKIIYETKSIKKGAPQSAAIEKGAYGMERWFVSYITPALAALFASAVLNPYGIKNLVFSFAVFGNRIWSANINEWKPLWYDNFSGLSPVLAVFILIFVVSLFTRIYASISMHPGRISKPGMWKYRKTETNNDELFEMIFATALIIAAFMSRRILPYALIAVTFFLAGCFKRLIDYTGIRGLGAVMGVIAILVSLSSFSYNYYPYTQGNALENSGTLFERMQCINSDFPVNAAKFLSTNKISGNMFCPWKWEGYMRLACPDIKIYAGARAQQVYDAPTYRNYLGLTGDNPDIGLLRSGNIGIIALPCNEGNYGVLIKKSLAAGWTPLYADSRILIIVDTRAGRNKALVQRMKSGKLAYGPEAARLMPYAELLADTGIDSEMKFDKLTGLSDNTNITWIYYGLSQMLINGDDAIANKVEGYYKSKLDHFLHIAGKNSESKKIYFCSGEMLSGLIEYYGKSGRKADVAKLKIYTGIENAIGVRYN